MPTTTSTRNDHHHHHRRDLLNAIPTPEVLTQDFVIRSLRRRLWKAFQEDDGETALRAYQASREELVQWLQEEEEERQKAEEMREQAALLLEAAKTTMGSSKEKRGSYLKRLSLSSSKKKLYNARSSSLRRASSFQSSNTNTNNTNGGGGSSSSSVMSKLACKSEKDKDSEQLLAISTQSLLTITTPDLPHHGPILQSQINPSEPFIADDFLSPYDGYDQPAQKMLPDPQKISKEKEMARRKRRSRRPRLAAFNIFRKEEAASALTDNNNNNNNNAGALLLSEDNTTEAESFFREDANMTTPLHEAARLGSGDFLRLLLANGGDPNVKNGYARTALHMCSGGVVVEEERLTRAVSKNNSREDHDHDGVLVSIGIHPTVIPPQLFELMNEDVTKNEKQQGTARKAARAMGRMIKTAIRSPTLKEELAPSEPAKPSSSRNVATEPDRARLDHLLTERMDAVLALLSWSHVDSGDGPSINAVDADGRTALHYAAEMARADVCMAILSNFGAMLTIVDDLGARTPCELAADRGHSELAAQLEARAVLYVDPYGLDDELMADVLTSEMDHGDGSKPRNNLVPPFNWFETLTPDQVAAERARRLKNGHDKLNKAIQQWDCGRDMKTIMASAAKNGLNAALKDDDDDDGNSSSSSDDEDNCMRSRMASAEKVGLNVDVALSKSKSDNDETETDDPGLASRGADMDDDVRGIFANMQDAHVEKFLSHYNWNVSEAVKVFRKSPGEAFKNAGIPLPKASPIRKEGKSEERMCLICYDDDVAKDDWSELTGCIHGFCADCLSDYLKDCAASKQSVASISCPHHDCDAGMSPADIDYILAKSPATLARIAEANNEQFVSSACDLKFCTHPGCPGVVKRVHQSFLASIGGIDVDFLDYAGAACVADPSNDGTPIGDGCTLTYEGVEDLDYNNCRSANPPKRAHRFCFACGEGMHWPVTCEQLEEWKQKMREEIGEVEGVGGDDANVNDVAQKLWIKANTRACPQCNVPIEKNDGCNHMTCTNPSCRHEFCWICRRDWKLHGTATGGFFRCNIWREDGEEPSETDGSRRAVSTTEGQEDPTEVSDQGYGTAIHTAREAWKHRQEMARFLHHFTRWEAHGESATLELKMCKSVCSRLAPVVEAAMDFDGSSTFNFGGKGLSFVHSAFTELLECRSTLRHSYAFSFFRYPTFYHYRRYGQLNNRRREKTTFEKAQSDLEMMTEQMSDIVARSHLRATQIQIAFLTSKAAEKRADFSNLMFSIFNEERKETQAAKTGPSSKTNEPKPRRRYRNMPSPFGSLGRVFDDSWSSDNDQMQDDGLRSSLDEFMSRAMPLEPPGRAEDPVSMWACSACTYMNSSGHRCAMCGGFR